jgi:hypothetical protein
VREDISNCKETTFANFDHPRRNWSTIYSSYPPVSHLSEHSLNQRTFTRQFRSATTYQRGKIFADSVTDAILGPFGLFQIDCGAYNRWCVDKTWPLNRWRNVLRIWFKSWGLSRRRVDEHFMITYLYLMLKILYMNHIYRYSVLDMLWFFFISPTKMGR